MIFERHKKNVLKKYKTQIKLKQIKRSRIEEQSKKKCKKRTGKLGTKKVKWNIKINM